MYRGPGDPKRIADALRTYIAVNDLSQAEAAFRLGLSQQSVSAYLTGARLPSADRLMALSRRLGVNVRELLRPEFGGVEVAA